MAPRGRPTINAHTEEKVEDEDVEMNSDLDDSDPGSQSGGDESGREVWRASEPPKESFSDAEGANEDGEWRFEIISEEVRHDGKISLEVMWSDWRRRDGTRTTWHLQEDPNIDSTRWTSSQKRLRQQKARESMEVEIMTTTDIHNTATYLRNQAFKEKLRKAQKEPQPNWVVETAKLMAKHQEHIRGAGPSAVPTQGSLSSSFSGRASQRSTTRQQTEASYASLSSTTARSSSKLSSRSVTLGVIPASTPPAPSPFMTHKPIPPPNLHKDHKRLPKDIISDVLQSQPSPPLMSLKAQGKQREIVSDIPPSTTSLSSPNVSPPAAPFVLLSPRKKIKRVISESDDEASRSSKNSSSSQLPIGPPRKKAKQSREEASIPRRLKLQQEWSEIARGSAAARISFVNDVDDEVIPQLDPSFRYLESSYEYAPGIELPDIGFLLICSCRACEEPAGCECQGSSEFVDESDRPMHAYTQTGLFAFNVPRNLEVVECNTGCGCSLTTCKNRVSQRPRDVPIEVFKTQNRGWGARATIPVKRGKVLGIYTGRVLPRAVARKLPASHNVYTFDLDGNEMEITQSTDKKYTVDSRNQGNWTRFINHSCTPNLQIYLVVHDTPTNTGMPYIAFVAAEDIPARTEFTIDYNPRAAAEAEEQAVRLKSKKKGKPAQVQVKRPQEAEDCFCDSPRCRGFI